MSYAPSWLANEAGLRFLKRRRASTVVAIAALALALGANTAVFSVLKAFLLSFTKGANADTAGTIEVSVDGTPVDRLVITKDNNDLLHMVDLKAYTHAGARLRLLRPAADGGRYCSVFAFFLFQLPAG